MINSELDFQRAYKTFYPKILRYLIRLVGKLEAEDLTQEVFLKASQGIRNFRGDSQLSTWIYRIATNAALDRLRCPSFKQIAQEKVSVDSITEEGIEIEEGDVWMGEKCRSKVWQQAQIMRNYLIDFKEIDWEIPAPGIRQKVFLRDGQRIRLVEFSDIFVEADWCTKGHIGYILEGRIFIDFNGKQIEFKSGDGLFIPEGESNKHKGSIKRGEKALIILFEKI